MGFIDAVSKLISRLGSKRKSTGEDSNEGPESKKARYELTPLEKFTPANIQTKRSRVQNYIEGEIVRTTETRNYEFKAGGVLFEPDSLKELIKKYGSAFLNCEGGVILGGVLDDGVIKGVSMNFRSQLKVFRLIQNTFGNFRPQVSNDLYRIKFVPVLNKYTKLIMADIHVVEITIRSGKTAEIYETGDHKVYVRRDGGVQGPLRPIAIKDLAISKHKLAMIEEEKKNKEKNIVKNMRKENVL